MLGSALGAGEGESIALSGGGVGRYCVLLSPSLVRAQDTYKTLPLRTPLPLFPSSPRFTFQASFFLL